MCLYATQTGIISINSQYTIILKHMIDIHWFIYVAWTINRMKMNT